MPNPFFDEVGVLALGTRLRRLSEQLTEDARAVFEMYGMPIEPKCWPVFQVLSRSEGGLSTKELAERIGQTHASISQITNALERGGLVARQPRPGDARVKVIHLTAAARELVPRLEEQCEDVEGAARALLGELSVDLWRGIDELESRLDEVSLHDRVKRRFRERRRAGVQVVDYRDEHREAFRDLNLAWIERYFVVEQMDREYLEHPQSNILDKGGAILMVLDGELPIGTVALLRQSEDQMELAKMAIDDRYQGRGLGRQLGEAALDRARELGARTVYLESTTRLDAAMALYRKLGFRPVTRGESPYARCNVQMELDLG